MTFKKLLPIYFIYLLTAILFSGVFYYLIAPLLNITEKSIALYPLAWLIESFIVFIVSLLVLVITRRQLLALIVSLLLYVLFLIVNVIKIRYLQTPLYPIDFLQVGDLFKTWELFKIFLPFLILTAVIIVLGLRIGYRKEAPNNTGIWANTLILTSLVFVLMFFKTDIDSQLRTIGIYHKKNANLARRGLKYGYLTNFTQAALFAQTIQKPKGYDLTAIRDLVKKYQLDTYTAYTYDQPDNVIVLLVEAFTDPLDMGWQFTEDPIPSFRSAQKAFGDAEVFSPVYGGKSINAEFELMTGLSNRFTPIESMPYQEFVDLNMPGLVSNFGANGYSTNTLQVIRFKGFGYGKIYGYLGVDHKISLADKLMYEQDPTGKFTGSSEIAEKIIQVTQQQEKSFVFAFPNSTHSPWYLDDYPGTSILLQSDTKEPALNDEISAYANALRHTDDLLGLLMTAYQGHPEKTLIVMMGDHQPGLRRYNEHYNSDPNQGDYANTILKSYRVPLAIWANYPLKASHENLLSMNLLPSYVLEKAQIPVRGMMKFNGLLRDKFSVISHVILAKGNEIYHQDVPDELKEIVNDYEMLQYDLLFGEKYLKQVIQ